MTAASPFKAVLWDFGGVFTSSPFDAFNRYEAEIGLPAHFIRGLNATNSNANAWAKLERGEVGIDEFYRLFEAEAAAQGRALDGRRVLGCLAGDVRPEMVAALKCVNQHYQTACLTNNAQTGSGPGMARSGGAAQEIAEIMALFDFVVESSKAGVRKPEPRFYRIACDKLEIEPHEAVFLDDLGVNLKPARAMGMSTIKVDNPEQALSELEAALGIKLK